MKILDEARRHYIPELDGIRAVAVLLVITAHIHSAATMHRAGGHYGVVIFFVLSGYLITSISLREEKNRGRLSFAGFYIRRTFRIFPVYYFVLALYAVLILGLHISADKGPAFRYAMPYYLLYMQEVPYFLHNTGKTYPFYQSWSLGIEEKFYFTWPFICFGLLRSRRLWRIPVAVTLIIVTAVSGVFFNSYTSILFGCLLALLLQSSWARSVATRGSLVGCYLIPSLLIALHVFVLPHLHGYPLDPLYATLVALWIGFLLHGESVVGKLLSFPPLVMIGKFSYSIYLIHVLCLNAVEKVFPNPIVTYLGTVVLATAIAGVLHVLLEQPMIKIGRRLARGRLRPAIVAYDSDTQASGAPEVASLG